MSDPDFRADSITSILSDLGDDKDAAFEKLIPRLYDDLRRIAHNQLLRERADHTLATTSLVHEAYIRLSKEKNKAWKNRSHFFAVSSMVMRRVLVDYARSKNRKKRGGGEVQKVDIDDVSVAAPDRLLEEIIGIDDALKKLAKSNQRAADIIQFRFFSGLTLEETAQALELSVATVQKSWSTAKAWLQVELSDYKADDLARNISGKEFE